MTFLSTATCLWDIMQSAVGQDDGGQLVLKKILLYCAAFVAGLAVYLAIRTALAVHPFLPWEYGYLRFFTGMTFPGGAPPEMHFLSHLWGTWLPFLAAFLTPFALTKGNARFQGAILIYAAFLIWSWAMMMLVMNGLPVRVTFYLGLGGTFFGGLIIFLRLVLPTQTPAA
jgi:hypothetical protein